MGFKGICGAVSERKRSALRVSLRFSPFTSSLPTRCGCNLKLCAGCIRKRGVRSEERPQDGGEARAHPLLPSIANKFRHAVRGEKELVSD